MPYLTCSRCRFTVTEAHARSPFQNCPRCLLRSGQLNQMMPTGQPRFARDSETVDRIAEAKARLTRQTRGVRSA